MLEKRLVKTHPCRSQLACKAHGGKEAGSDASCSCSAHNVDAHAYRHAGQRTTACSAAIPRANRPKTTREPARLLDQSQSEAPQGTAWCCAPRSRQRLPAQASAQINSAIAALGTARTLSATRELDANALVDVLAQVQHGALLLVLGLPRARNQRAGPASPVRPAQRRVARHRTCVWSASPRKLTPLDAGCSSSAHDAHLLSPCEGINGVRGWSLRPSRDL